MLTFLSAMSAAVTRRPGLVIAAVVVLTAAFGGLASQAVTVDDDAAIDNPAVQAQDELSERFGDEGSVVQVIVSTPGQDVRGLDGLAASLAVQDAAEDSPVADLLPDGDGAQPAVLGFLAGAEAALEQAPIELTDLEGDDDVVDLQDQGFDEAPDGLAEQAQDLVSDPDGTSESGLVLVFLDTEGLASEEVEQTHLALVEAIEAAEVPDGVEVEGFSFPLLFAESDIGPEVGQLFGAAFGIILLVLATVYWVRPEPGSRAAIVRRTAADVALTLTAILFAIVWMQGTGVLLGPDYVGLIGYFTQQTQIVPILVVGLGVDYAIHLNARYRDELAAGASSAASLVRATRTVGVALSLATATTVVGFLTNIASPVEFLATFGVLAAAGILASFLITLTFLPAARILLDHRADRRGAVPRASLSTQPARLLPELAGRTAVLAERVPVATLVVALALAVVGGYGFTQLESRFSLTDFIPTDEPRLETFDRLAEDFDGGFGETTEVLFQGDLATPDGHNALIEALEDAGELDDVATVDGLPDGDHLPAAIGQAFAATQGELAADLEGFALDDDLTVADDTDVGALYETLADAAGEQIDPVLAQDADGTWTARAALRTTAGEEDAAALRADLEETFAPLAAAGVTATPTSEEIVSAQVAADIEDSQLVALAIALGAATLLLVVHFGLTARRPLLGVVTLAPVALVLAWTFGMMAVTGIPLTPVTATLAALAIGIGVPFTIHVTVRFLELRRTMDRTAALRGTARRTGGALVGSALTTMVGFGVLTTSTLVPFAQLGFVTVYAIGFALIASILVLPSLLALWDRLSGAPVAAPAEAEAVAASEPQPTAPAGQS